MNLKSNLESLLAKRNDSPTSLALRSGVHPSTILRILSGESEKPRNATVAQLALALGVQPKDLLGDAESSRLPAPIKKTNFAGLVPLATSPLEIFDNDLFREAQANPETVWVPIPPGVSSTGDIGALKVDGDALAPRIRQGDIVFLEYKEKPEFESGSVVLAYVCPPNDPNNGKYVLRRLIVQDGEYYLRCDNPDFSRELVQGSPVATVIGCSFCSHI